MRLPSALWPLLSPLGQHREDARCAVSATGVRVKFADGSEKLCGTSGLWNCPLGYGNRAIAETAARVLHDASYLTVWGFEHSYAREAADALIRLAGPSYGGVLFSTSGGSANDAAMKLVRQFHSLRGEPGRRIILALRGGYHGLTYGAFALSDVTLGQQVYGVDRRLVGHIAANDSASLDAVLEKTGHALAGVFVEPVIGNGATPVSEEFIGRLCSHRSAFNYLIVADEIATGFHRTGSACFASATWPSPPDVLLTAKALTNGTQAASALLVSTAIRDTFLENRALLGHAETQAGTPLACASILATISEMDRLEAANRSTRLSTALDRSLNDLSSRVPLISGTRGSGCMRSLLLAKPDGSALTAPEIDIAVDSIHRAGALVHPGPSCLLLLPAFTYTDAELDELLECIGEGLSRSALVGLAARRRRA